MRVWVVTAVALALCACRSEKAAESAPSMETLPICEGGRIVFFGPSTWEQRSPIEVWTGAERGAFSADYSGQLTVSDWADPMPSWAGEASPAKRWVRLPDTDLAVVLPAGVLEANTLYDVVVRVEAIPTGGGGKVVSIRDASGGVKLVHARGDADFVQSTLAEMGWTLTLHPACQVDDCYRPLIHHSATLETGALTLSLPDRDVATVTVGGATVEVFSDALAAASGDAHEECLDVKRSLLLFSVVAVP